jgi:acetyl-CoA acetyltransferase
VSTPHGYDGVVLTTPVSFGYRRFSLRDTQWYLACLLKACLDGAGIAKRQIDGLALASFTLAPDGAAAMAEQLGLELRFLEDLHVGGTSAVLGLRRAARAVEAGEAEIVACLAADAMGRADFEALIANFSTYARDAMHPYGAAGPNAVFAMITEAYMARHGTGREDFGKLCVAQRTNALRNPHALFRRPLTIEAYLASRPMAEPLHLFDCVMPCCGGEAFLVMRETRAKVFGLPYARLLSSMERHNAFAEAELQAAGGWALGAADMYQAAGVGPEEMDFLQAYDDYPVVLMMQLENLGFCDDATAFVRRTAFETEGGGLPLNTSGGQLSVGQAGAAGGFLGMVEGIRQLTGETVAGRVPAARHGLVSGFGMVNFRHGVTCGAAVLARGAAA